MANKNLRKEKDQTTAGDVGPAVLQDIFTGLQIDDKWSIREARGFQWWAYHLRQRVWADPPRKSAGDSLVCVHADTDYLKEVPDRSRTYEVLASTNAFAGLSTLVFDPSERTVGAHSTAYLYQGNLWLVRQFETAAAFQDAEAHAMAQGILELLGEGKANVSDHPKSGIRPQIDDMLHALEGIPGRADPSAFSPDVFRSVLDMEPKPWLLASGDGAGITAEFEFFDSIPAVARAASSKQLSGPRGTAILMASGSDSHPRLGNGLLLRLGLPLKLDAAAAARLSNELNLAETKDWTEAHLLGSWCTQGSDIWFVTFVPSMLAASQESPQRAALLYNLIVAMAIRARWAKGFLDARKVPLNRS